MVVHKIVQHTCC